MLRRDEDRKCPRMKGVFGNFQGNAARKKRDKSHELSRILGNGTERNASTADRRRWRCADPTSGMTELP